MLHLQPPRRIDPASKQGTHMLHLHSLEARWAQFGFKKLRHSAHPAPDENQPGERARDMPLGTPSDR